MRRKIIGSVVFVLLVWPALISGTPRSPLTHAYSGGDQPLASQATPGVEGNWLGALDVGGFKLRLVLKIAKSPDGKLAATVDSLDQNAKDLVVDTITFQDGTLKFEMKALNASYVGTLSKDGAELSGQFTQGGVMPLDF